MLVTRVVCLRVEKVIRHVRGITALSLIKNICGTRTDVMCIAAVHGVEPHLGEYGPQISGRFTVNFKERAGRLPVVHFNPVPDDFPINMGFVNLTAKNLKDNICYYVSFTHEQSKYYESMRLDETRTYLSFKLWGLFSVGTEIVSLETDSEGCVTKTPFIISENGLQSMEMSRADSCLPIEIEIGSNR